VVGVAVTVTLVGFISESASSTASTISEQTTLAENVTTNVTGTNMFNNWF